MRQGWPLSLCRRESLQRGGGVGRKVQVGFCGLGGLRVESLGSGVMEPSTASIRLWLLGLGFG